MQPHEGAVSNGRPRSPAESVGVSSELDGLRLVCQRQARVIDQLSAVASNLRSGAAALRAENAELRSVERMGRQGGDGAASEGAAPAVCLPLDARAPGAARIVVGCLSGRLPASLLADAQLIVSELVSNSVCHSGASAGAVVLVRVGLTGTMVRVEVKDSGRAGVIAPRAPDLGGGFGLNLVQGLSERWGLERVAAGGTRVWAQLARASAPASAEASGCRAAGDRLEPESQAAGERPSAGGRPREMTHDGSARHV
jgi:anti-sigma regulatory factor (Ser/Thr protein kinase)